MICFKIWTQKLTQILYEWYLEKKKIKKKKEKAKSQELSEKDGEVLSAVISRC